MAAKGLGNQLAFGTGNDVTDRRLDLKIEKTHQYVERGWWPSLGFC